MTELIQESERVILSNMMRDENSLTRILDQITSDDITDQTHKSIFNAIVKSFNTKQKIPDLVSVYQDIEPRDTVSLDTVMDSAYWCNPDYQTHVDKLKQNTSRNKIKSLSARINAMLESDASQEQIFQEIENVANQLNNKQSQNSPEVKDILNEINTDIADIESGKRVYIPANNAVVSDAIPGYYRGHLIVIGGYTSVGKSTYLTQILHDICLREGKVLIFSVEDSRKEKIIKMIANISEISQRRIITGQIGQDKDKFMQAQEEIMAYSLKVFDDIYTTQEIRYKIKIEKMTNGCDVVAIDFIQNMQGQGKTLYENMSRIITDLQKIAKELQVTIIVLSQVSNDAMRNESEVIGLKGAGELASAADIVLWLKQNKEVDKGLLLQVKKNRPFGVTGEKELFFNETYSRIRGM